MKLVFIYGPPASGDAEIDAPEMPEPAIAIDTEASPVVAAAARIAAFLGPR